MNPIQQLKNEHITLGVDMERFYETMEEIEFETGDVVARLFDELYKQILAFQGALEAHSQREEEGLFPLMSRHLGAEDNTIEVMEIEHEKAEQHLRDFLAEADSALAERDSVLAVKDRTSLPTTVAPIDEDEAQSITIHAMQAHTTLVQHFAKEEKMLFPLAEKILTSDDMSTLEHFLEKFDI